MSAADRYFPPKAPPKRLDQLTRQQLAARIVILRGVLDWLWRQSDMDGGLPFRTIGRAKVELIELEGVLRELDRAGAHGEPLPLEVALALVGREG